MFVVVELQSSAVMTSRVHEYLDVAWLVLLAWTSDRCVDVITGVAVRATWWRLGRRHRTATDVLPVGVHSRILFHRSIGGALFHRRVAGIITRDFRRLHATNIQ